MTIAQVPNPPLIIAAIAYAESFFTKGFLHKIGSTVFYIAIIIWAYEELFHGVNWFRKILGAVVLTVVAYSLINQLR